MYRICLFLESSLVDKMIKVKGFTSSGYGQPDVALTSTVGPFSKSWLWSEVHDLTVPGRLKFSITLEAALAALATLQNLKGI